MKGRVKNHLLLATCAVLLFSGSFVSRAYSQVRNLTVAVVNIEKIYQEYGKAQADVAAFKAASDAKQAELEKMQGELKALRSDFDAKKEKMKEEEKKATEKILLEKAQAILTFAQQSKATLQKDRTAQTENRLREISGVINAIAVEGKIQLVIDKKYVPYFDSKLDISEQVIKRLNK